MQSEESRDEPALSDDIRPHEENPRVGKNPRFARPFIYHALRLLLGAVFLYASYDKILRPQAFAKAVYNYQILPDAAVNLTALILPWLEFLLGLCLVAGVWLPGATATSTGLLTVFIGVLVFNQIRRLDIHCGCFSTESTDGPDGIWTVARDAAFLAVSIFLTVTVFSSRSSPNVILRRIQTISRRSRK